MDPSELRGLMEQTATAQLEIQRRLAELSEEELWALKGQLDEERLDLEAELRLLKKAIALKEERGDVD